VGDRLFGSTEKLLPGIKYLIRMRAYTRAGAGPFGNTLTTSVESNRKLFCISYVCKGIPNFLPYT